MMEKAKKITIGQQEWNTNDFYVIAGPCSVESYETFSHIASHVKAHEASALRGGIYKLRTDPNSFQGLREKGFPIAKQVSKETQMPFVTEVTDPRQIESLLEVTDIFQVGSRNMYNYDLLKTLGEVKKPVLLKRGFSALTKEWLLAAEYLSRYGNSDVILCERGIRTFETSTRNTLDLNSVALIKKETSFPVIVDPSHGTGRADLVTPLALASILAGADGLIIETHNSPALAKSDGEQALTLKDFETLMTKTKEILPTVNKKLWKASPSTKNSYQETEQKPLHK